MGRGVGTHRRIQPGLHLSLVGTRRRIGEDPERVTLGRRSERVVGGLIDHEAGRQNGVAILADHLERSTLALQVERVERAADGKLVGDCELLLDERAVAPQPAQ